MNYIKINEMIILEKHFLSLKHKSIVYKYVLAMDIRAVFVP